MNQSPKRALVDAARELLTERAPAAISGRELADRADVTYGLIGYHFGTKDQLLRQGSTELRDERRVKIDTIETPSEAVDVMLDDHRDPYMQMIVNSAADAAWWHDELTAHPDRLDAEMQAFGAMCRKLGVTDSQAVIGALAALHLGWVLCNRTSVAAFDPESPDHGALIEIVRSIFEAMRGIVG